MCMAGDCVYGGRSVYVSREYFWSRCTRLVVLPCVADCCTVIWCCSVLQCVAVCCSVLQCGAVRCSVVQCVAVATIEAEVLQCVAVCCSGND